MFNVEKTSLNIQDPDPEPRLAGLTAWTGIEPANVRYIRQFAECTEMRDVSSKDQSKNVLVYAEQNFSLSIWMSGSPMHCGMAACLLWKFCLAEPQR